MTCYNRHDLKEVLWRERERERESVCERERVSERERVVCLTTYLLYMYLSFFLCRVFHLFSQVDLVTNMISRMFFGERGRERESV